ncbi:MAG: PIG-L deacetylase family protein [Chthonomonadales bacterium]
MQQVDLLAIGGHAGDAEISAGMALCHHVRRGHRVAMLHLTLGERGHPTLPADTYARQKRREAMEAAKVLQAQVAILPYPDGELPVLQQVQEEICDVIRACRPSVVLTHWGSSIHKDHEAAHFNVMQAHFFAALRSFRRPLPAHSVQRILFAENWEDARDFVPELFLEIDEADIELWEQMVRCYGLFRGEWPTFRYVEYYKSLARTRGLQIGSEFACAFAVPAWARQKRVSSLIA